EEAYGGVYRLPELVPVDLARLLYVEALQVYAPEVAGVVGREMGLTARIRRLYGELRRRVFVVVLVDKDDAGLALEPRAFDDLAEEVPRPDGLHDLAVPGVLE